MINRKWFGAVSLVVLAALTGCSESPSESPAPAPSPSASLSASPVVGTWALVKYQAQPVPGEEPQPIWEFGDTEFRMTVDERTFKGTYETDTTISPNRITIDEQPESGHGIFRLTDDTLTVKISKKDKDFAKNFEPEEGYELMEFRRK